MVNGLPWSFAMHKNGLVHRVTRVKATVNRGSAKHTACSDRRHNRILQGPAPRRCPLATDQGTDTEATDGLWIPELSSWKLSGLSGETRRAHRQAQQPAKFGMDEDCARRIADVRDLASELKEGYEQWLRDRLLRVGASILPFPAMPHAR